MAAKKTKRGIRTVTGDPYEFWERIPWEGLSEEEQKAFAHVGWCDESNLHNSYDLAEKYAVSWDGLDEDVQAALASLGFNRFGWDVVLSNCADQCDEEEEGSDEEEDDESGEVVDEDGSESESDEKVMAKMAYNKTRPHKHGGKAC